MEEVLFSVSLLAFPDINASQRITINSRIAKVEVYLPKEETMFHKKNASG